MSDDYGHTPFGYRPDPFAATAYCQQCNQLTNTRDLVMGRFCTDRCMERYDRRSKRQWSGGSHSGSDSGSQGEERRPRPGGLYGF